MTSPEDVQRNHSEMLYVLETHWDLSNEKLRPRFGDPLGTAASPEPRALRTEQTCFLLPGFIGWETRAPSLEGAGAQLLSATFF